MNTSGHWEGKLLDASGVDALVELDLRESDGELRGTFRVALLPEPDGCGGPTRGETMRAAVEGRATEDGRVLLRAKLEVAGSTVSAAFEARHGDPDPHARDALYGLFAIEEGASELTLQGGACVLWQYADARRRKAS